MGVNLRLTVGSGTPIRRTIHIEKDGKPFAPGIQRERYLSHPEVSWLVCAECLMYHNTVWAPGEGPEPPLHVGCNCQRVPDVDLEFEDYAFWTKDAAFDQPSDPYEFLSGRLKDMTRYEQDRLFGKTIAKMLRNRVVRVTDVVTPSAGVKPLERVVKDTPGLTKDAVKNLTQPELRHLVDEGRDKAADSKAASAARQREPDLTLEETARRSVEEEEAWARSKGIAANFGGRADIGGAINDGVGEVAARGLPLPKAIQVSSKPFKAFSRRKRRKTPGAYDPDTRTVYINPEANFWSMDPRRRTAAVTRILKKRLWASVDVRHPIRHELAHDLYRMELGSKEAFEAMAASKMKKEAKVVARAHVSLKASDRPTEFVAEVYAGILAGRTYPDVVLEWYRKFGGPRID
jgi:hypothetical protein